MSYMNLVYGPARHESYIVEFLKHPTGVRKVIGSIPARDMLITSFVIIILIFVIVIVLAIIIIIITLKRE